MNYSKDRPFDSDKMKTFLARRVNILSLQTETEV